MGRSGNLDSASTSFAPGFRFHPTDEELVSYYLKRKICGKSFRFDAIAEIDVYKVEPWDLPGLSKLRSRDLEWYFFSCLDRKYGNGSRTNRATFEGYWKTTGKDRPVHHRSQVVGMKKTLVYHQGSPRHGKRSNWVMHEYKLVDETLEKAGISLEGAILCRIFQKSGPGPMNGVKYGAPFIEEEWENDDVETMVPGDVCFEEPSVNDAFIEQNDLDKNLNLQLLADVPGPVNHYHDASNIYVEDFRDLIGCEDKSLVGESGYNSGEKVLNGQEFVDLPVQVVSRVDKMQNEHMELPNDVNDDRAICFSNGTSLANVGDAVFDDGLFLDAFDFLDPADENALDVGAFEQYLEDDIDIAHYLSFDSPELVGNDTNLALVGNDTNLAFSTEENLDRATCQLPVTSQQLPEASGVGVASSQHAMEALKPNSSKPVPFLGEASRLLGNIHAPPAFASEFPSKDLTAWLNALQSSNSVHVTADMIRVSDMAVVGSRLHWSLDKTGNVNVLLSFDLPQTVSHARLGSMSDVLSSKLAVAASGVWSRFMFFWVFAFAASFKIGSYIYAK